MPSSPSVSNEELARRAQVGCMASFEELVRRLQTPLVHFLRQTARNGDADDLAQDTFLRAYTYLNRYDGKSRFSTWLFTIGRRTALDLFRSEYRPTRGSHETEQDGAVVPPGLEQAWEEWQVRQAIAELTDEERAVVRMVHYHRMTHSEIAEVLQVPLGTVKSRSHRAHHRLVRLLGHLADPTGGGGAG